MAVVGGPNVVTDSLVFAYDMGNLQESWKGKPTTNLVTNSTFESGNTTGWVISNATTGSHIVDSSTFYSGTRSLKINVSNGGDQYQFIGHVFGANVTGQSFSVSAKIKTAGMSSNNQVRCLTYWYDINNSLIFSNLTASTESTSSGDWVQLKASATAPNGTYGSIILIAPVNKDGYGSYWIDEAQIEQNSFATPFVEGTRSNTQAILDLSGNNTITATSLTYNSDGTFEFNGVNDSLNIGTTLNSLTTDLTVDVWVKLTNTPSDWARIVGTGGNTGNRTYGLWVSTSRRLLWQRHGAVDPSLYPVNVLDLNTWYNVVAVTNGSSHFIYLNGQQIGTTSGTGPWPASGENVTIGYAGFHTRLTGVLSISKIYNRALSAAEVFQNYNALKSRFGL